MKASAHSALTWENLWGLPDGRNVPFQELSAKQLTPVFACNFIFIREICFCNRSEENKYLFILTMRAYFW